MGYDVRKWVRFAEEIRHDTGPEPADPVIRAVCAAVIRNPYAGDYRDDLSELVGPSGELGAMLVEHAVGLLGGRDAESYGKGAIAGVAGEQEHAVACITTPFGDALREGVGGGAAWVSSNTKVGSAGEPLDVPLAYKDALFVRSHYDTVTLRIPDAPRPNEIVVALAVSTGGRVHHRLGGLARAEAIGDGVR